MSCTVRLYLLSLLAVSTSASVDGESLASLNQQAQTAVKAAPFTACIDDSDCKSHGDDFACFQYVCYPWRDDSKLDQANKKATCKSNEDCPGDLECFRHHDRRQIHRGLCMEPILDCSENGSEDCKDGPQRQCCNGQYCCAEEYFDQLRKLPCVNDISCRDLGYGNFCCPSKIANSTEPKQCCNENPNPPTTTTTTTTTTLPPPVASPVNNASSLVTRSLSILVLALGLVFLRY